MLENIQLISAIKIHGGYIESSLVALSLHYITIFSSILAAVLSAVLGHTPLSVSAVNSQIVLTTWKGFSVKCLYFVGLFLEILSVIIIFQTQSKTQPHCEVSVDIEKYPDVTFSEPSSEI